MIRIEKPSAGRLEEFRKVCRGAAMRKQLLKAVSLIRAMRVPEVPAEYGEEFLYAAWCLAAQDTKLARELEVEAERYVLGYELKKLSHNYAWNGQFWAYTKLVAEELFGVAYVAFINPGVVDKVGVSKKHSHKEFANLAARSGRDMAEFTLGYDLLLSNTVSFAAGERLNALLQNKLGYGVLPDVFQHVEEVDLAYNLVENVYNDTYMMSKVDAAPVEKVTVLSIDGTLQRVATWLDEETPSVEEEAKPTASELARRKRQRVAESKQAAKKHAFPRKAAQSRPGSPLYAYKRLPRSYKPEDSLPERQDLVARPVSPSAVVAATLRAEAALGFAFPAEAFTPKPDLSSRVWRDEVKVTKVLRLWRDKPQSEEDDGPVKCPPELGQKVSDRVITIAKHLHGQFEGRLFEDVLTELKVSHDIVENSEICRIRVRVQASQVHAEKAGRKLGAQYLGQLCMVAAHIIHDRDDMSRHLELENDENECHDYVQLDAGESSATFLGQWLWQARLEKQFGHLPCPQVQHALRTEFDIDFSDESDANKEALFEAAANTLHNRVKGPLNNADFAKFGLSELCEAYCQALQAERRLDTLRELQASRERLFNVESVIAKSPDHEELEKLVKSECRLPKGVIGQLAHHRVRHTQVCNELTGIERVPVRERVVQLQDAVACYHRKAPQGLIAQLAQARLSASL